MKTQGTQGEDTKLSCLEVLSFFSTLAPSLRDFTHDTFLKSTDSPFYFCKAAYLFGGFLLLCIYVCFPKTLAKFNHSPIDNECHGSILLLVLIKEQQSTPANRNTRSCVETQILDSCDYLTDSESG